MFCREQAVRIKSFEKELSNAGIQLAGIGNGTAAMAREFSEKFQISYPLYTDPQRQTYKALGMKTRLGFSFKTPLYVGRALRNGFLQGRTQGSPFQQGGEALISSQAEILWSRVSNEAGSHASQEEIRQAIKLVDANFQ